MAAAAASSSDSQPGTKWDLSKPTLDRPPPIRPPPASNYNSHHALLSHRPTIDWVRRNRVAIVITALAPASTFLVSRILAVHPDGVACTTQSAAAEAASVGRSPIVAVAATVATGHLGHCGYIVVALALTEAVVDDLLPQPPPRLRPNFYGWFLGRESACRLAELAAAFVAIVVDFARQQFSNRASLLAAPSPEAAAASRLHVTAKFCGHGGSDGSDAGDFNSDAYAGRPDVAASLGRAFDVRLTGLLMRPGSSLAARAELSRDSQLALWDLEPAPSPNARPLPRASRAHVTLATATGVRQVRAGYDLLEALRWMLLCVPSAAAASVANRRMTAIGVVSRLGNGSYYLELAEPLVAKCLFSGQY